MIIGVVDCITGDWAVGKKSVLGLGTSALKRMAPISYFNAVQSERISATAILCIPIQVEWLKYATFVVRTTTREASFPLTLYHSPADLGKGSVMGWDWSSVPTATGRASELAPYLDALLEGEEPRRDKAFSFIYGKVVNQGDLYAGGCACCG
ncbi:hypothetical protein GCM10020001_070670 [Nonomuraea salmonea]